MPFETKETTGYCGELPAVPGCCSACRSGATFCAVPAGSLHGPFACMLRLPDGRRFRSVDDLGMLPEELQKVYFLILAGAIQFQIAALFGKQLAKGYILGKAGLQVELITLRGFQPYLALAGIYCCLKIVQLFNVDDFHSITTFY